jgi:hypothetical protein
MKEFTAIGHHFDIGEVKKLLSYQGSSNCETVCFLIDRYSESTDLSQCSCIIKTKNSNEKTDVILPNIEIAEKTLRVLWTVSSATTSVPGKLSAQIQFEKLFSDNTKNIVWQSNIMEFEIAESLKSADEVYDQNPTLFQQWNEKINITAIEDDKDIIEHYSCRPDAAVIGYGAISFTSFPRGFMRNPLAPENKAEELYLAPEKNITTETPPFFIWQTNSDDPRFSMYLAKELADFDIPFGNVSLSGLIPHVSNSLITTD